MPNSRPLSISLPLDRWDPRRGGAEIYLDGFARELCRRGHQVTVLCMESGAEGEPPPGLVIECLPVRARQRWRRELEFARRSAIRHRESGRDLLFAVRHPYEADVFQPHGGCIVAARRGKNAHRSRIGRWAFDFAGRWRPTQRVLRRLERELFARSPEVVLVANSRKVDEEFRRTYPNLSVARRVIHLGVDTERFHDRDRSHARAGLESRIGERPERLACFIAHQFAPKGLGTAVRALGASPGWRLAVAGRGDPSPFRTLARRLGVADRVHFLGPVDEPRSLLAAADALVLPTHYDACALVVLESMSCGTPVVASTLSGSGELLEEFDAGCLISPPDDVAGVARALRSIAEDWNRYHTRALASRPRIAWARHVDEMERLLVDVASERQRTV